MGGIITYNAFFRLLMHRFFLLFVAFLLLFSSAWSLQAADAESAVVQGNFLESGETAVVFQALPQTNGSASYWVVSLFSGSTIRGFIALTDKDSALVPATALRTQLFSANYLVQRLTSIKSQTPWLISLPTVNKLVELANAIENESFDVDIVSDALPSGSLKQNAAALKGKLATLASDIRSLSEEIKSLNDIETTFLNVSIDTGGVNGLPEKYNDVFDAVDSVKAQSASYDQDVSQLKNAIASSSSLDAQSKSQLIALLSPLGVNQTLSSAFSYYSDLSADNQQRLSIEFASLETKVNAFSSVSDDRVLRSEAFSIIYSPNEGLSRSTRFSSLQEAASLILAEENRLRWVNQSAVNSFSGAWENAANAFEKKQYSTAKETALKAIDLVKQIDRDGINDAVDPAQQASEALITGFAYLLVGIALILLGNFALKWVRSRKEAAGENSE